MTFTDDDLKRLKECVNPAINRLDVGFYRHDPKIYSSELKLPIDATCYKFDLVALLARLEVAERLCELINKIYVPLADAEKIENALIAWRKAAGK